VSTLRDAGLVSAGPDGETPERADLEARLVKGLDDVEELLRASVASRYPFITEVARHLVDAGGKRVRPLVVLLAALAGGGPEPDARAVTQAAVTIELTHLSTLYHDDVIDEAVLRRGVPSVNARWGNTLAVCGGDFLFARAAGITAELGAEPTRILADTIAELCEGEMRESVGPQSGEDPVDHHLGVLREKTGSLLGTAARLGCLLSGGSRSAADTLARVGELYGVAFQLSDDLIDLADDSGRSGKTPGTDLREGVATLPVLLARRAGAVPGRGDRLGELLSGPVAEADLPAALALLRAHPALGEAREVLASWAAEAREALRSLPVTPARAALDALVADVVTRTR